MNLLDTIRQNTGTATQPMGMTDETSRLQGLLRAKSGKALGGPAVAASNVGEQAAVSQANQQLQTQVAPQAAIQNKALAQDQAGIQQQERIQRQDIAQTNKFNTVQNKMRTEQLLADAERSKGQLDLDRDKATVNQLATNLRMQNNQYVDNLQREGARSRLNDDLSFKEEIVRTTMGGANMDLLKEKLNNQSILSASDRDFKKAMAQMDVSTAYDMFKNDMAEQKQRALYSGIGGLTTAGIGAYGTYQDKQATKPSGGAK